MAKRNPYEMLLDENNNENIIFYDQDGNPMEFEQIALLEIDTIKYTILHPVNMGYADDEVIAFSLSDDGNEYELLEVEDDDLLEEIYAEYKSLLKRKNKK